MTQFPSLIIFFAYLLVGPVYAHQELLTLALVPLTVACLAVAILSSRSAGRQSMALLAVLGIMSYETILTVVRWLHIELTEMPLFGGAGVEHLVPLLFTLNVALSALGVVAAVAVALSSGFRKARLPLAKLFPEMIFIAPPPEVVGSAKRLAQRASVHAPQVVLIDSGYPAAFITRSKDENVLALSVGLLESLNHDELLACIAHELAHIKNSDFTIRAFATSARLALFAHPLAHLIEPALYRTREFLADKAATKLVGERTSLISALSKIQQSQDYVSGHSASVATACLFASPSKNRIASLFDRHPSMEARIRALREQRPIE